MSWPGYDRADLVAIAIGGAIGATLRSILDKPNELDSVLVWNPPELADAGLLPPFDEGNLLIIIFGIPYSTLLINIAGCLILGALTPLMQRTTSADSSQAGLPRYLLGVSAGFCGSFTTFSTFAVDAVKVMRGRPQLRADYGTETAYFDPDWSTGLTYVFFSVAGGALAFWLGRTLARRSLHAPGECPLGEPA